MRPLPTGEPWGDYAVSTARWTGALLHDVLALAQPAAAGVDVLVRRGRPRALPPPGDPPGDQPERPHLRPRAAPRRGSRPGLGDPDRLRDERRTARARPRRPVPAHRAALVRRRVGEVAEADRRPDRALHRGVPDRPLHLPVAGPPARGRAPHAGACPDHRPRSRRRPRPSAPTRSAGRPGRAPGPITQVDVSLTGEGDWHPAQLDPPKGPYQWQDWSLRLGQRRRRTPHPARPGDRRRRQRPTRRPPVEPAGLREQRHRGHLRRPAADRRRLVADESGDLGESEGV